MDFTFSEDQDDMRASVRSVLVDAVAKGTVRSAIDGDLVAQQQLWARIVELGWHTLLIPGEAGGLGLGLVDAVVVLEEMGRCTLPGPFLSSAVVATSALIELGESDLLSSLTSGERRATVALEESGTGDPVRRVRSSATRSGSAWTLTGSKPVVLDPAADHVIVAAQTREGLSSFMVDGPIGDPVPTLDPSRQATSLTLDGRRARRIGPVGDHSEQWARVADIAAVALSAELVGVCDAALAMAIAYANQRVQFDVAISSHQVIQHKFVDMLHQLELGRVGVHRAAWAADVRDPSLPESAAIAKSAMGGAAVYVTGENIQIHGAAGFTWDSDAHLLFKRAKQNDVLYGSRHWHDRRVADLVLQS
ncbi:Butyryl-CoA dehydrogenase [uncultured Mycobacterium sp.]|uniref:Butyryl-CoA dehydrogenase n=1 Tax=uncultured Mycobacterium sp. TaxID=171292 RepID=A0A1Y5NXB3_9MYCO|nr:Butyryl-CoA dehydrogenase [uncultured Mycobacterium sp.]